MNRATTTGANYPGASVMSVIGSFAAAAAIVPAACLGKAMAAPPWPYPQHLRLCKDL